MKRQLLRTGLAVMMVVGMLLPTALTAVAQDATRSPAAPAQTNESDDGALEVGVWYVQDYEYCGGWGLGDLSATAPDALGLRDRLTATYYWWPFAYPSQAWYPRFTWGNGSAWEEDWKRPAAGGADDWEMDQVDLAYFSGHGSTSGFFFGVGGNRYDDCQVTASDAYQAWGTLDNDWVGIGACNVLDDPAIGSWANAMNGTRLVMGMKTVMSDVDFGVPLGWYIRWNKSMGYSWFKAAAEKLPSSQIARILGEDWSYYNDTWANHASPTAVDNWYYWWTYRAGDPLVRSPESAPFNASRLPEINNEMPVLAVQPLSLDQANQQFANVATAFGLTSTTPISAGAVLRSQDGLADVNDMYVSGDADLLMDSSAGNFSYANSGELWNANVALQQLRAPDRVTVSPQEALGYANSFMNQNGFMPAGVQSTAVYQDELAQFNDPSRGSGTPSTRAPEKVFATPTNYQVLYNRVFSYTVPAANGKAANATVLFDIVGPGGPALVNVNTTVPAGRTGKALLDEAIEGAIAGNRQIAEPVRANGSVLTTPVMPTETVTILFDKLAPLVALGHVPLATVNNQILEYNLGYYEGEMGFNQDQLIPVYALKVLGTLEDGSTQEYTEYIPVNATLMAPYAKILAPTGPLFPGQKVTLEAADASKTLAELGVDPALNFVLGSGDPDSYASGYDWYLGEVADANHIGSGRTVQYTVPNVMGEDGKAAQIKIILVVKDTTKQGEPNVSTDKATFTVEKVFLPLTTNKP